MLYGIYNFERGIIDYYNNIFSNCLVWFIGLKMFNNKFIGFLWMFYEYFINKIYEKFKEIYELFMIIS